MKVGIYCDSGINGGHEEMLKRFMMALVVNAQIETLHILAPRQNIALFGFVEDLARSHPKVQTIGLSYTAESIRGNPFALLRMTRSTASVLRGLNLTRLLIAQGTIVSGLAGLFAARLTGTRSVSYLPLVGDGPDSARLLDRLKWLVKRGVYRMPDEFITLNEHLRAKLRTLAPNARTTILANCVDDRFAQSTLTRSTARAMLGLPDDETTIIAHIGRIDFRHKRQDFLLESIERHPDAFERAIVLIVGEGPDAQRTTDWVQASPVLSAHVRMVGAQADVLPYIAASDALVLPSAFEGVPLVMIEAVLAERPIVVSRVSGLDAYLPETLLFPPGDHAAFVQRIFAAREVPMAALAAEFRRRFSRETFEAQAQRAMTLPLPSRDAFDAASPPRPDVLEK
ncbi:MULTISPECIES: glycosyltransferase family 4 protein [unclassified Caballeronia]|uniref:glycosyltransferase family 4 protein n=1 Tax=unclassified Caballeronia TaxID=2646786 RepID=UPI00202995E8|nr:glycosyltransferase family 4 protein [Caballeronia sp. Sq4a]